MILLVGLGNPDIQYQETRHNAGFMAVDEIIRNYNFAHYKNKFKSQFSEGTVDETKIYAIKPSLYMNRSGISVGEIVKFYKIPLSDVIVIHDDIDVAVGKIKVKTGGGNAGHNGLKSIDSHIGKDYTRIRIGISRPSDKNAVSSYVLNKFTKEEHKIIDTLIESMTRAFLHIISGDYEKFTTCVSASQR